MVPVLFPEGHNTKEMLMLGILQLQCVLMDRETLQNWIAWKLSGRYRAKPL